MREGEGSRRGRFARRPREVPAEGWKDILARLRRRVKDDHLSTIAAGIAFYLLLSLFPWLIAVVSLYALAADPAQVQRQLDALSGAIPADALAIVRKQLEDVVSRAEGALTWSLVLGVLVALWSSTKGTIALIGGVGIAYDEDDRRGFLKMRALALLFSLATVAAVLVLLGLVAVLPAVLDRVGLGEAGRVALSIARWPVLAVLMAAALAAVYRYAPDRENARWRWVSPGGVLATLVWLAASALFSVFAANFGNFGATYGGLAGVVVLMLWLQISVFVVLLGAELNAETEHQTAVDSTTGPPEPMGARGAVMADTLGASRTAHTERRDA